MIGFMAYLIHVTARHVPQIWNPYDILGISESATEKQINSHYKKMALKFHPDKIRPDVSKNETIEMLNERFVELSKAYKALTDEEVRNNFIQYGHPDGKQSFSIGIALPKFIVSDGNGKYVILVYGLLLGVLLPYLVGSWWYGTQAVSKEGVLINSANNLFREYPTDHSAVTEGDVLHALSTGVEFQNAFKGDRADAGLSRIESCIDPHLSASDRSKLEDLDGSRRKALALLWAYLLRIKLNDPVLDEAKYEVAPIARALNNSFTAIALAFGFTSPILASYHTAQHLIQAIPPHASPLLQLPHFTAEVADAAKAGAKTHLSLQQFMQLPETQRRSLVVGKGLLTEGQYKTAVDVARKIPHFNVAKAFFKVVGEKHVSVRSSRSFSSANEHRLHLVRSCRSSSKADLSLQAQKMCQKLMN